MITYNCVLVSYISGGPIPHNLAQTFDGPPILERSDSEQRRSSFLFFPEVPVPYKGNRRGA